MSAIEAGAFLSENDPGVREHIAARTAQIFGNCGCDKAALDWLATEGFAGFEDLSALAGVALEHAGIEASAVVMNAASRLRADSGGVNLEL